MSKKNIKFYKLPIQIAASKELTHSEKIIAAYLFTLFGNGRAFYGTNAHLSTKLNVQKSVISPCLTKFERLGWITITNRNGNKRCISFQNNPCDGSRFYRLYSGIAATNQLTSLEKVLISYILSFIDSGKRFYAKNDMVKDLLDISKEGFNTSRIKFEELNWIQVKYPKSPRRELVVVNHPSDTLPSDILDSEIEEDASENISHDLPNNNVMLPENTHMLPLNNDNIISDKRSNKRKEIIEDTIEVKNVHPDFSFTSSLDFNINKETSSTREASPEANTSNFNYEADENKSSTKNEAHASAKHDEEHTSTKQEAHASTKHEVEDISTKKTPSDQAVNNLEEGRSSSFSETLEKDEWEKEIDEDATELTFESNPKPQKPSRQKIEIIDGVLNVSSDLINFSNTIRYLVLEAIQKKGEVEYEKAVIVFDDGSKYETELLKINDRQNLEARYTTKNFIETGVPT